MSEPDPRLTDERTDRALTRLEALADEWAVEVDLPSLIKNVVSPMRLNRGVPNNVRENFIGRMESQIDAIIKQAYIEGAYRNHCATADIELPCAVTIADETFQVGASLGRLIRKLAGIALKQNAAVPGEPK